MKRISLLLLIALSMFVIYQIQKPILSENNAIIKAKEYVKVGNEKMNSDFDTEKQAEYCLLRNDKLWNRIIGNRQWSVMIDGVVVDINANTGEFVEMGFPLDGVINELPK